MIRRWVLAVGALVAITALVTGLLLYRGWERLHEPYRGWGGGDLLIQVERGSDSSKILTQLEDAGVIADARSARHYLVWVLGDPPLQAGEYRFSAPVTTVRVLDRIIQGDVVAHAVTLIEGSNRWEIASTLRDAGLGSRERFLELFATASRVRDLAPEADSLEGYLFPETYHFTSATTPEEVVSVLVNTFRERVNDRIAPLLASRDAPLDLHRLVTLASIVEKEAAVESERAQIAGVYQNRLDRGIALYADPTIIYGLILEDRWNGNLTRSHLESDGPYNTYLHTGLPPGPICSPSLESLEAAARPADVPYLYFVSRNDGTHAFAESLREHNRNVERWQRRYWRERSTSTASESREETGGDVAENDAG